MKNIPLPLFDTVKLIDEVICYDYLSSDYCLDDIHQAKQFLKLYTGSQGTFNSYRREIERLIHWAALIEKKGLRDLTRHEIEAYISFCCMSYWIFKFFCFIII